MSDQSVNRGPSTTPMPFVSTVMSGQFVGKNIRRQYPREESNVPWRVPAAGYPPSSALQVKETSRSLYQKNMSGPFLVIYETP